MKSFKFLKQEDFDAAYAELAKNYQHIILDEDQALFETLSNKVLENLQRFLRVGFPNQRFDEEWPEGVCFGKIVCAGGRYVAYIMHNVACDWLKLTPAEAKTVFARWKEKRMLVQTSEGRTQYRTNLQGKKVYTYAIELDAETKGHYLDMPVKPKKAKKKSTKPLLEDDGDKKDTKA